MNIRSFRYTSKADQLQHMALTLVADTEARASAYARLGLFAMLMRNTPTQQPDGTRRSSATSGSSTAKLAGSSRRH
ncbi:MAG: hypothetical protein IJU81_02105 [Bacteroidales bacterium]|nr:hypothetical protein [Bacteroidales bacterium]